MIFPSGLQGGGRPQTARGQGKAGPMLLPTALGLGQQRADKGRGPLTASPLHSPQALCIFLRPLAPFSRACVVTVSLSGYLRPTDEGRPHTLTHTHPGLGPPAGSRGHCTLGAGGGKDGGKGLCFPPIPFPSSVTPISLLSHWQA